MNPIVVYTEKYLELWQDGVCALMFLFSKCTDFQMFCKLAPTMYIQELMYTTLKEWCSWMCYRTLGLLSCRTPPWSISFAGMLLKGSENNDSTLSNLHCSNCITFSGTSSLFCRSLRILWYTLDINEVVEVSTQFTADWERVWRSLILRMNLAAYQFRGSCSAPMNRKEWERKKTRWLNI